MVYSMVYIMLYSIAYTKSYLNSLLNCHSWNITLGWYQKIPQQCSNICRCVQLRVQASSHKDSS